MNVLKAAEQVLSDVGKPLHYQQITQLILDKGLWTTQGETPDQTVNSKIAVDIKYNGANTPFQRTSKGFYALRSWGLSENTKNINELIEDKMPNQAEERNKNVSQLIVSPMARSFTDAAEYVLKLSDNRKPMHYRDITKKALELRILKTTGQTPDATMYAQILTEIARQERRGEIPRFMKLGKGRVSLTKWQQDEQPPELAELIDRHNQNVRKQLHERLYKMTPTEFEELVSELLIALGLENVSVTHRSHDGGIDVRGILVIGEVVRLQMAVQAKRWKENIPVETVRQVRGSLSSHERGLIITTSDYSKGAKEEAAYNDRTPIYLMNGEQLVSLLIEHNIGVERASYNLLELKESK